MHDILFKEIFMLGKRGVTGNLGETYGYHVSRIQPFG